MKKKLLLIIICFFAFSSNAFSLAKVNRMDVEIAILEDGMAEITEVWQIGPQNNNYFEKNFYDVSKTKIGPLMELYIQTLGTQDSLSIYPQT